MRKKTADKESTMRTILQRCRSGELLQPTPHWKWARFGLALLGALLLISLVSIWTFDTGRTYPRYILRRIRSLIRDAVHWNTTSAQDANPLLALMHSTYAIAYLNTARHMVSDSDIERVMGVQPRELMFELQGHNDALVQKLVAACPSLKPPTGKFGVHTGWVQSE